MGVVYQLIIPEARGRLHNCEPKGTHSTIFATMTILTTCQMRCSRDNDEIRWGCIERALVSSEFRIARNSYKKQF
jgi:hypothetical protein